MKAYKVVTKRQDGSLGSLLSFDSSVNVTYHTDGSEIFPKVPNSLLFILRDEQHAKLWASSLNTQIVNKKHPNPEETEFQAWEVEVPEIVAIDKMVGLPNSDEVLNFWNGAPSRVWTMKTDMYGASSLKMVRRIS